MNYTIEIIRLVAVILITFTHIRHNFTDGPMFYMLEVIPKYGTLILSLVSGYLYNEISSKNFQSYLQKIEHIRVDCDADTLLYVVHQIGAPCHTGYETCFFRELDGTIIAQRLVDPDEVYDKKDE